MKYQCQFCENDAIGLYPLYFHRFHALFSTFSLCISAKKSQNCYKPRQHGHILGWLGQNYRDVLKRKIAVEIGSKRYLKEIDQWTHSQHIPSTTPSLRGCRIWCTCLNLFYFHLELPFEVWSLRNARLNLSQHSKTWMVHCIEGMVHLKCTISKICWCHKDLGLELVPKRFINGRKLGTIAPNQQQVFWHLKSP